MLHSRYFIVDKCYSVFFFFKNLLVSQCHYIMIILRCNYHTVLPLLLILSLLLLLVFSRSFYSFVPGVRAARPATPARKTPLTLFCLPFSFLSLSLVRRLWRTHAGKAENIPPPLIFFSLTGRSFSLNYKARKGSLVPPRSFVAFIMINDRDFGRRGTMSLFFFSFVETRISKNTMSFLSFFFTHSLFLSFSFLSYIYTYLYIYYIYRYIYSSLGVCHTLNGTSDRRSPPTAGAEGKGVNTGSRPRREKDPRFGCSTLVVNLFNIRY